MYRAEDLRLAPDAVRLRLKRAAIGPLDSLGLQEIGGVIIGGESGPNARPLEQEWVRTIRNKCLEAGVPFFHKQWGGRTPKAGGRLLDGKLWNGMPAIPASEAS